jgi:16S rRNA (guanine527-N7)-methyltransferase
LHLARIHDPLLTTFMDADQIAALLTPYAALPSPGVLAQLQRYLDLLLRWNARTNLTAVRDPDQIVTRHFGESLFAANVLFGNNGLPEPGTSLADLGSGAGFPGIPIKLFVPDLKLTLIESQNKKATFLREAIRALELRDVEVFQERAEHWNRVADVVTLRAVERFEQALPVATSLVRPEGRLCLLIGESQIASAQSLAASDWKWSEPHRIPGSIGRVVVVAGKKPHAPV